MQPNIVVILTDQQTRNALGCVNPHLRTPHMDTLAARGVRFEHACCPAPVCGPARAAMMTGRMPHRTGVNIIDEPLRPDCITLGDCFRDAGYTTAYAGKWHVGELFPPADDGTVRGFEYLPMAIRPAAINLGLDTDGPSADAAIAFLRRPYDRPFLLTVSLHNPHDICYWIMASHRERFRELLPLRDEPPPLPANFAIDPVEPEFIADCRKRDYYGPENTFTADWTEADFREYLNIYYRLTELVDTEIGRILTVLDETSQTDDTLIVFTSDHGEGVAAHHWVVKLSLYEEVVGVPLFISLPGHIPPGIVDTKHLAGGVDLVPTLCDFAGIAPPPDIDGQSLRPVIDDPSLSGRDYLVCELHPDPQHRDSGGRMLRTSQYKYNVFSHGERPEQLFDMHVDPGETRNLATAAAHAETLAHHRELLRQWMTATGDGFAAAQATGI
ncbi:MAG: sulfatase [Lentisphaeria bacterium]